MGYGLWVMDYGLFRLELFENPVYLHLITYYRLLFTPNLLLLTYPKYPNFVFQHAQLPGFG